MGEESEFRIGEHWYKVIRRGENRGTYAIHGNEMYPCSMLILRRHKERNNVN